MVKIIRITGVVIRITSCNWWQVPLDNRDHNLFHNLKFDYTNQRVRCETVAHVEPYASHAIGDSKAK